MVPGIREEKKLKEGQQTLNEDTADEAKSAAVASRIQMC
jgi:hypothetical protein